jgi:DNA-binding transcriptional LysR family regulator
MSFAQVTTFLAVAESGSITAAARRLHISQPPLTRRLKDLEDELGTQLFVRSCRGTQLSPAGRALYPHAQAVLAAIQTATAALAPWRSAPDRSAIGAAIAPDRT